MHVTGKPRDIHRYQFKVNALDNDINFLKIMTEPPTADNFLSEQWDTAIIKMCSRVEIGAPSVAMHDCISCQEVINPPGVQIMNAKHASKNGAHFQTPFLRK